MENALETQTFGNPGEWKSDSFNPDCLTTISLNLLESNFRLRYTTSAKELLNIFNAATPGTIHLPAQDDGLVPCSVPLGQRDLAKLCVLEGSAYRHVCLLQGGSVLLEFDLPALGSHQFYRLETATGPWPGEVRQMAFAAFGSGPNLNLKLPFVFKGGWKLQYDAQGAWTNPQVYFPATVPIPLVAAGTVIKFLDHACLPENLCSECHLRKEAAGWILNSKLFSGQDYSGITPRQWREGNGVEIAVKKGDLVDVWDSPSDTARQLFALGVPLAARSAFKEVFEKVFDSLDFQGILNYWEKSPEKMYNYGGSDWSLSYHRAVMQEKLY